MKKLKCNLQNLKINGYKPYGAGDLYIIENSIYTNKDVFIKETPNQFGDYTVYNEEGEGIFYVKKYSN